MKKPSAEAKCFRNRYLSIACVLLLPLLESNLIASHSPHAEANNKEQ